MAEKNISQGSRLKNIDETRNYLIEEINWNKLISKKCKKVYTTPNYNEHFLILAFTITRCISISAFATGITSSTIGLKICAIFVEIKRYKSIK